MCKDGEPTISRRALLGGVLGVGVVAMMPGTAEASSAVEQAPEIDEAGAHQPETTIEHEQPALYEDIAMDVARLHAKMEGKSPDEIVALADGLFAEGQQTAQQLHAGESIGLGFVKGFLLTIDAAFLYASVYPLIEDSSTRTKLRAAITACHGIFTAVPLLASKIGYENFEEIKRPLLTGVGVATLAGISYLRLHDGQEPEPEEFAEAAEDEKLARLIVAMPVVLVSIDAATAGFGGSTTMETQEFNVADYAVSTAATLATIYGLLQAQDYFMTKMSHKHEEDTEPRELGKLRAFAARVFGLDPNDDELTEEAALTAASGLISSYAFRGILEGAGYESKYQLAGFTLQSVILGATFTALVNHAGNLKDRWSEEKQIDS